MSDGPGRLEILADGEAIGQAAAELLVEWVSDAVAQRGEAHLALTGGSSVGSLYKALRSPALMSSAPWGSVHLWFGDERYVPLDHPASNGGVALALLLGSGLAQTEESTSFPVPAEQVHFVPVAEAMAASDRPQGAAARYATELNATIGRQTDGVPAFDVILLGVGPDGHTLSVFPGSSALDPDAPMVVGIPAPTHVEPHLERVTLAPRLLEAADRLLVMVSGRTKSEVVAQVLGSERDPSRWPAQLAVRPNATWLLDLESAALLDSPLSKRAM